MPTYDRSKALISLHVPKTAGTSFRKDLEAWFGLENLFFHYRGDQGEPPARTELRPGLCVHGHFNRLRGIGALDYYPQAEQFIIFLRNPFDRFVSLWRYLHYQVEAGVRVPELDDRPDFAAWMARRAEAAAAGEDPFSFLAQFPAPIDRNDPASAFSLNFLGVGITEDYARSMRLFAKVLGFPPPASTTVLNTTAELKPPSRAQDFAGHRKAHEAAFPFEYAVYEEGRRRFEAQARALL